MALPALLYATGYQVVVTTGPPTEAMEVVAWT
jgi:hypothetical protein